MRYQVPKHISKDKIFIVKRSEIEGRFDPSVYKDTFKFVSHIYSNTKLSEVAQLNPKTSFHEYNEDDMISFVPMENIDEQNAEIVSYRCKTIKEAKGYTRFKENDLLWAKITPCMQNGKSAIARNLINGLGCGSTEFFIIICKDTTKN